MSYLGIDIGGTTTKAGLVDQSGQVVGASQVPTIVDDLKGFRSTVAGLIQSYRKTAALDAIGIGIPGFRSYRTGVVQISPNIPCLKGVSLEKELAEIGVPVVTANDANAAAYGEFILGAGRGVQYMLQLTLGTGLGSGFILGGRLFEGASGYAAEFGHTVIEPNGRACTCGSRGCLETVVSNRGIVATALEKLKYARRSLLQDAAEPLTSQLIFEAASQGDITAREVFEETGRYLGIACANLINLLNPEMIVIGGGIMASGDMLLLPAHEEVRRRATAPAADDCRIVQSKLWPDGGVIGAAMLARDR